MVIKNNIPQAVSGLSSTRGMGLFCAQEKNGDRLKLTVLYDVTIEPTVLRSDEKAAM